MENKQQNFSRSSNVKINQTSEVNRKTSDTHLNKARRRDHSNSSRNDTASRSSRQTFNNNSNNQKKNQSRWNNDKRPRPRGGGSAGFTNFFNEGISGDGGAGTEASGTGDNDGGNGFGGGAGNNKQNNSGRNSGRNGYGSGSYNPTSNESDSSFNITSSGLTNNPNSVLSRHGKKIDYELNSVYAAGSKKQNLNHLLNFHYSPRDSDNYMHDINFFGRGGNHFSGGNMQRHHNIARFKQHKYNKEQFLQANFQFVINNNARPKFNGSPDALVDWNFIEQINIQTTEEPQCPICLYPPMAAKITRCGHVYCWSCILHYLSLSDKNWRRCPICFEAIYGPDLKSCTIVQQRQFMVGEEITFRLMRRRKGSLFIEPFNSQTTPPSIEYYPEMGKADSLQRFSKFLIAKRSDVQQIIERERKELLDSGDNDIEFDDEEAYADFVFVQQALSFCHDRMKQHGLLENTDNQEKDLDVKNPSELEVDNKKNLTLQLEPLIEYHVEQEQLNISQPEVDENKEAVVCESPTMDEVNLPHEAHPIPDAPSTPTKSEKYHYFYQSDDGQNIYLHPLNIKMLQACYGSLDKAPGIIIANIVQKEQFSMDEEHRRRLTCLSHLPLTCECSFVEVDLQPPNVTAEILNQFKEDILYRKKIRQRRQREENKRERKINEFNDRQMGKLISSTANINISSPQEFPSCGFEGGLGAGVSTSFYQDEASGVTPSTPQGGQSTSYSNITVFGGASASKKEAWPAMGAPSKARNCEELSTAWRRQEVATKKPPSTSSVTSGGGGRHVSESESYSEDYDVRALSTSLGDVLAEAMSQSKNQKSKKKNSKNSGGNVAAQTLSVAPALNETSNAPHASSGGGAGNQAGNRKKNKKSKKGLPIFATGLSHKGND